MRTLIFFALIGCALSASQGYGQSSGGKGGGGSSGGKGGGGSSGGKGGVGSSGGKGGSGGGRGNSGSGNPGRGCPLGQVPHIDGSCVTPEVKKHLFVYEPPEITSTMGPPPTLPKPKIYYNIVFVRTPETPEGSGPLVVPPPQQKTLVYVLSKNPEDGQEVIEVPAGPKEPPKVFYVNYKEGEDPQLPGGITLQEALEDAMLQESQSITSDGNSNGSSNNGGGNYGSSEGGNGGKGGGGAGGGQQFYSPS